MKFNSINDTGLEPNERKALNSLNTLLAVLNDKSLSNQSIDLINREIDLIHQKLEEGQGLRGQVLKSKTKILKHLEKEEGLVPKNHYQRLWLVLGMSVFGIPIGVLFGFATGNMGLLGVGLPIGMFIGLIFGKRLDKKAADENRQLDFSL